MIGNIADRMPEVVALARSISGRLKRSRKWNPLRCIDNGDYADRSAEVWENEVYSVTVRRHAFGWPLGIGPWIQLGISSHDGEARHDWRDFQAIKNNICGEEWEAIELFPAESRLLDPSNYYMLWCAPAIQIGKYEGRVLADEKNCIAPQRGFPR